MQVLAIRLAGRVKSADCSCDEVGASPFVAGVPISWLEVERLV
jgi:hypothetical protein